jgi:hypothetical protein
MVPDTSNTTATTLEYHCNITVTPLWKHCKTHAHAQHTHAHTHTHTHTHRYQILLSAFTCGVWWRSGVTSITAYQWRSKWSTLLISSRTSRYIVIFNFYFLFCFSIVFLFFSCLYFNYLNEFNRRFRWRLRLRKPTRNTMRCHSCNSRETAV